MVKTISWADSYTFYYIACIIPIVHKLPEFND